MCWFSAVSKLEKKTIAPFLFLYIELHYFPFSRHKDCGFHVSSWSNFFCQLCTVYTKAFFSVSAGWGEKKKSLNKRKSKTFFTVYSWDREFQCNPLLLSKLNNKKSVYLLKSYIKMYYFIILNQLSSAFVLWWCTIDSLTFCLMLYILWEFFYLLQSLSKLIPALDRCLYFTIIHDPL